MLYLECTFQVLYEISYAYGTMMGGFSIFTLMPRERVNCQSNIQEICSSSTVLVVESDESAPDPVQFLGEVSIVDGLLPTSLSKVKFSSDIIKEG